MQQTLWNTEQIKQCELEIGQKLLTNEEILTSSNRDFGGLVKGQASLICTPIDLQTLQKLLAFATRKQLPVTIRSHGLSQSGQSLAPQGGLILDVSQLNTHVEWKGDQLLVGCSATWKEIIAKSLKRNMLPYVFPYNTNLTLGGVLSVGGLGSSTFKEGMIAGHIEQLSVITATGELVECDKVHHPDLFQACLCGTGLFGIIYNAVIQLRPAKSRVKTYTVAYDDYSLWLEDQFFLKNHSDYLEAFVMVDGEKKESKTCLITFGVEYDDTSPDLDFIKGLRFSHCMMSEDKSIEEYIVRHDPRLNQMKESGNWSAIHPWYECYIDANLLITKLDEIIQILDGELGGIYHIFPVAPIKPRYFMLPDTPFIVTFNVLTPGISNKNVTNALQSLLQVDRILLEMGGKRYISGWFDDNIDERYWVSHFGVYFAERKRIKAKYDPAGIFCSQLFGS